MQINILGFGNMGQAIARALVVGKYPAKIFYTDRKKARATGPRFDRGFKTLSKADIVMVAVKPQDIPALAGEVRERINKKSIIVSIAAGVTVKKLAKLFRRGKVIRMMPNLGLSVGQGIAAWKASGLAPSDKKRARRLLDSICKNFEVANEKLMDAVTAVSGNGPAYFFFLADSLMKAGQSLGLSASQSRLLVERTMTAASKLQIGQNYLDLIKRVRSNKGTTDASLKYFQKKSVQSTVIRAVREGFYRARELSR